MLMSASRSSVRRTTPVRNACLLAIATALLLFGAGASQASIIDTTPYDLQMSQDGFSGPDIAGGTFTADDAILNSFTLYLGAIEGDPTNDLRAVVLAVNDVTGQPTGSPLWTSAPVNAPATSGPLDEFVFAPQLPINSGQQYFIGIDSGLLTSALGGDFTIGLTSGNPMAGGQFFFRQNNSPFWMDSTASDIASRIQMSSGIVPTPEPTTALLLGMGLAFLGARRRSASV